jgi:hypothetical protein
MSIHYEDIKTLISRLDGIWREPEYQPFPEADEFNINEDEDFEEVLGVLGFSRRRIMGSGIQRS